jgi:hypothetical protein
MEAARVATAGPTRTRTLPFHVKQRLGEPRKSRSYTLYGTLSAPASDDP